MKTAGKQRPIQECEYTATERSMNAVISFLIIILQGKAKMPSDSLENLIGSLYVTVIRHTTHSKTQRDAAVSPMSEDTG